MNSLNHFLTKRLMDMSTEQYHLSVLLFLSGLFISVGLFTMIIMNLIVSGDSMTQRQSVTTLQSTQQK